MLPSSPEPRQAIDRRQALGLLAAAPLAVLDGCERGPGDRNTLTFWTVQLSPQFDDYVRAMLKAFEAARPGTRVLWVDVPWSDVERKLLAAVAAGTAPDVVNLNPQFAARLAQADALADPSSYLSAAQQTVYLRPAWNANRYDGRVFALPWYLTTPITIINRALFTEAGLTPPTHMAQLPTLAREMRRRTGRYAYYPSLDGSRPMEDMVLLGAKMLNAQGTGAGFDNAEGRAAFGFYRDLYRFDAVPRDVLTEGHQKALDLFQSGELAMMVTGMETLGSVRLNAPSIMPHIGVAPQLAGADVPPSIAVMNLAVPRSARDKPAAFALAAFVTGPVWQARLTRRAPVLMSTVASPETAPFDPTAPDRELLARARAISVAQLRRGAVLVPPLPNYSKLRSSMQRGLELAMLGRLSVDAAVTETAQTWNALLSRAGEAAA